MSDKLFEFESKEIEEDVFEETEEIATAKGMQNILRALDSNDFEYYEKFGSNNIVRSKEWTGEAYPALRWMSAVGETKLDFAEAKRQGRVKGDKKGPWPSTVYDTDNTAMYLQIVNAIVNPHFWMLGTRMGSDPLTHAHLQFLLLACVGQGLLRKPEEHLWIPKVKSKRTKSKLDELLYQMYPDANQLEMKILRNKYSNKEGIQKLSALFGLDKKQEKELLKEI